MKKNLKFKPKIILIDGIARSGKTTFSNVIASLKNFESIEFSYNIENFLGGVELKMINKSLVAPYLNNAINEILYDKYLSRRTNFRKLDDATSIYNHVNSKIYINRLKTKEGDNIIKKICSEDKFFPFSTHDLMLSVKNLYKLNFNFKILEIYRNPFQNCYSWYEKKLIERFGKDKRMFRLAFFNKHSKNYPWYIHKHQDKWRKLNKIEKIVFVNMLLINKSIKNHKQFKVKKNILALSMENWLQNPHYYLDKICKLLKTKKTNYTYKVLKKLNIPRKEVNNDLPKIKSFFKKNVSKKMYSDLLALEKKYNNKIYNLVK